MTTDVASRQCERETLMSGEADRARVFVGRTRAFFSLGVSVLADQGVCSGRSCDSAM